MSAGQCHTPSCEHGSSATHASADQSQSRLKISAVSDSMETDADAVATAISMNESPFIQRSNSIREGAVTRKPLASFIQRKAQEGGSTTASTAVTQAIDNTRGSGETLPHSTRSFMEGRFGADFSGVRIHTDEQAAQLSHELDAQAFTVGNDIYFNSGKFSPNTTEGKFLLAHELTHTLQQSDGVHAKFIQRMKPCPSHLNSSDPVPPGWKPYYGPSFIFHCGFRGILEDITPSPSNPMNECFYDDSGTLVDANHPYSGCAGTPDYYDSQTQKWDHFWNDPGGIRHAGGPALRESIWYYLNKHAERQGQLQNDCHRACESLPWYAKGFCYQGCSPIPTM